MEALQKKLRNKELILMDGAMGTEILNRGVPTALPLWSAEALITHPEVVQQIYEDYIKAGAEIIITNTFSTTRRMFDKKGIGRKAKAATILACKLAQQARKNAKHTQDVYIAGSVSPLEDCYSPDLTPAEKDLVKENDEFVKNLKEGGVDFILIETMITLRETLAVLKAAKKYNLPVAVSFCVNDQYQLLGGESLKEVIPVIEKFHPLFVGVNCVSIKIATKTVPYLHKITNLPIAAYAQGDGEPENNQGWKFNHKEVEKIYLKAVKQWLKDGGQIIGGCCGTTPGYIKDLRTLLRKNKRDNDNITMQTQPSRVDSTSIKLSSQQKKEAYQLALEQIDAVLKDETHQILKMATINCLLKEALPYYFWIGFYLVQDGELIVGPYQGTMGCLHIAFGKGVCGTAAKTEKTQIVPDVNKFPGHIACDSKSKSEIVVPVFSNKKELIAVFDVDSTELDSFDEIDKKYLEKIFKMHFSSD